MIYFTSDHHFYHENIIKYCNRPFTNIDTMQSDLIRNYNAVVNPCDTVYFIGDFAFTNYWRHVKSLLNRLNGHNKTLIKGNHDRLSNKKYLDSGFIAVYDRFCVDDFLLVHNPADNYFNCKCICGHVHEKWKYKDKMINVSVDVWDFKPVSIKSIPEGKQNAG